MKNQIVNILFLFTLVFGITSPLFADPNTFDIKFPFYEDGRRWKKGCVEQNERISLTEYILDSETKENWSELVTTQYFVVQADICLEAFFSNVIAELIKNKPQNKIKSRIISSTPDQILAEWWIEEKSSNDQHEWVQIFQKNKNIGILRYTTRRMDLVNSRGKVWEDILSKASFEHR